MPSGYVVRDANGQALVYLYSRDSEAEAMQAKVLTADEARRIAINVAKLPGPTARAKAPSASAFRLRSCRRMHAARSSMTG
jgi:K+/H+ antiporter YhaU regulatory subunit KhtT